MAMVRTLTIRNGFILICVLTFSHFSHSPENDTGRTYGNTHCECNEMSPKNTKLIVASKI